MRVAFLCSWCLALAGCSAAADGSRSASAGDVVAVPADPMARAIVSAHNARRAEHCAPPLGWSDDLARVAQAWADRIGAGDCALVHSSGPYGENIAAGTTGTFSPEDFVQMWYDEAPQYDERRPGFSPQTGHFTQLVWVGITRVGCGQARCNGNGMDVLVCNYDPAGNVRGHYEENVLPTSCR